MNIYDNSDTICAISTPAGIGGIAVIRVSGPQAIGICDRLWRGRRLGDVDSHTAHLGDVVDADGAQLDQAVAIVFRAPRSFTGEDVVELSVHGSRYIQHELIAALTAVGARLAEPGEFTRRAFAAGRIDLAQAEAVADIIAADSKSSHRLAVSQMRGDFSRKLNDLRDGLLELVSLLELELDFSEEDVEFASRQSLLRLAEEIHSTVRRLAASFKAGDAIRRGVSVAIVGDTNVGKSTLLNRLLHDDRAIVSDVHGTTRDVIEDTIDIGGICFRFIDTAGIRETSDTVEALGIERTMRRLESARIVLWTVDAAQPASAIPAGREILGRTNPDQALVVVINKCDVADPCEVRRNVESMVADAETGGRPTILEISASTGDGIDKLEATLLAISGAADIESSDIVVTNLRHYRSLVDAEASIGRAIDGLREGTSGDFIAQDLRETLHHLSAITGSITTTDILSNIFSKFCVGK